MRKKLTKKRIKRVTFNSKGGFYLFVLASSYACKSNEGEDSVKVASIILKGTERGDFIGEQNLEVNQIIDAGAGNDNIITSSGDDVVRGGLGNDNISTRDGNDTILIVGTTTADEYTQADIDEVLLDVLSLDTLNGNIVDEAGTDNIDGGNGVDTLVVYGTTDLVGITVTNIENIRIHSTVTINENTFGEGVINILGDGTSVLRVVGLRGTVVSLFTILENLERISGLASFDIEEGVTVIVDVNEAKELELLKSVGEISGKGTLSLNNVEGVDLSDITVENTVNTEGRLTLHMNVEAVARQVTQVLEVFTILEGSEKIIDVGDLSLDNIQVVTRGFIIKNNQLIVIETELSGKQIVEFSVNGNIEYYTILLPEKEYEDPNQEDFDNLLEDVPFTEGVETVLTLPNLEKDFLISSISAKNGIISTSVVDGIAQFYYNSGEFFGMEEFTYTVLSLDAKKSFDFIVQTNVIGVDDGAELSLRGIDGNITASLTDIDSINEQVIIFDLFEKNILLETKRVTGSGDTAIVIFDISNILVNTSLRVRVSYTDKGGSKSLPENNTAIIKDIFITNMDLDIPSNIVQLSAEQVEANFNILYDDQVNSAVELQNGPVKTTYGSYTITEIAGENSVAFSYTLNKDDIVYRALVMGQSVKDIVTVRTNGGYEESIILTIVGINDDANLRFLDKQENEIDRLAVGFSSAIDGQIVGGEFRYTVEDYDGIEQANLQGLFGLVATSGTLDGVVITTSLIDYGTLNINVEDKIISFLNGNSIDLLSNIQEVLLTFTVTAIDGSTEDVVVIIADDGNQGVIVEDATINMIEGDLLNFNGFNLTPMRGPNYGTFIILQDGSWTYALNNGNMIVNDLMQGEILFESIRLEHSNGDTKDIIITIMGSNDGIVINGKSTGEVVEGGLLIATGDLGYTDDVWQIQTAQSTSYGSYSIDAAGNWTYNLDNTNIFVQILDTGETLVDHFIVLTEDGTSQVVSITIDGLTRIIPAIITGTTTGAVTEGGILIATGDLDHTDVNNTNDVWQIQTAQSSSYGSYSIDVSGNWTYNLDNTNTAVQSLNTGANLIDSFTVLTENGTEQIISITINGVSSPAIITGIATGAVTEDGTLIATGDLAHTDTDNINDVWQATAQSSSYGSYSIDVSGNWTYNLDNTNTAVQSLNTGNTLSDTFTVLTEDGTEQVVSITINGVNDTPIITGVNEKVNDGLSFVSQGGVSLTDNIYTLMVIMIISR